MVVFHSMFIFNIHFSSQKLPQIFYGSLSFPLPSTTYILIAQFLSNQFLKSFLNRKMSQGWGFAKENVRMATNQVAEKKKQAFWEVANQNVIVVPDIDAETEAIQQDVSNPMGMEVEKLVDFYDMQIETRKSTLPATEEGVDLSLLLSMIRTGEELQEKDEPWEFSKLKTEVYELVSKLNKSL